MALDAATLALTAAELKATLTDAKIAKIFEPTRDELVITLRTRTDTYALLLSARSGSARVCLTEETFENPETPPSFCMLMRKHLTGGRLLDVHMEPGDRIVYFDFQCTNEMGDLVRNTLCAELMGRYSNLVLVQSGKIIDALKRVDFEDSDVRQLLPGLPYTTPPKPYTEDSLLSAMENAGKEDMPEDAELQGLGTPATRAAMIEKLLSAGFVERKGKSLVPTKDGINLAVILPDMLKSPLLTAEWETRLTEIAKGSDDPQSFMQGIEDMTQELVKQYSHITEDGKKLFAPEKEAVGICPRCKSPVYEGKKNFYCSDRSCRFVMWKNDKFFESRRTVFSKKIAAALLKDGKAKVKGLYSERTGKTYDGTVLLCDTGEKYVNYRIEQRK